MSNVSEFKGAVMIKAQEDKKIKEHEQKQEKQKYLPYLHQRIAARLYQMSNNEERKKKLLELLLAETF